ncbi:MAG: peptidase m23 [Flavipsychrobacter sp.]|nr:peptidase m23 [Flavipsychrobacter sp.]
MTPEVAALSSNFEANRGKLPWPVEKGFISEGFGRHQHPVAEKVTVENYGVDIRTSPGSTARAVFEGTVTKVFFVDGLSWNVLINHGRYYTLYSRLTNVSVKKDQQVRTKQSIGTVGADEQGETVMNFQIWKDGNKMDPAGWIAR